MSIPLGFFYTQLSSPRYFKNKIRALYVQRHLSFISIINKNAASGQKLPFGPILSLINCLVNSCSNLVLSDGCENDNFSFMITVDYYNLRESFCAKATPPIIRAANTMVCIDIISPRRI